MSKKTRPVEQKENISQDNSGSWFQGFYDLNPSAPCSSFTSIPCFPYLDLSIYRESRVKSIIKTHSKDMYRLLENVHFDGEYCRVKCVRDGEWECCWDLAVRVQFFGKMQGMALYPKRSVSEKEKKIVYRSLILVNPYQLWDEFLVTRFWNIQERVEFLIARILFHECIHVMISLGNTLPSPSGNTDIFREFREMLDIANSKKLVSEMSEVKFRLWNLVVFGASGSESEQKMLERVEEIYEFLINEKYSNQKTGQVFHSPLRNSKLARKYAWIAAVKAGGDRQISKRVWQVEVRRLSIALRELYDGIDALNRSYMV
ncbi:hypothetical protein MSHOH_3870 [Methanosarcina horonobensis HB-1 = JCM 15518]|uniref:Uncharacterized protein n=1 Tax=Methanosarcina horonobensis HB-1 = JCM 15518 TaxID=1434110 RepID=A0A0E3SJE4_9EURY|nr:hypothetical protein [Methanosarcina horonobensis]AKB80353.1 hypothetical protein MSHOH_3870 [Methanosarcina horonobensis HB-1 = JCM 15518]